MNFAGKTNIHSITGRLLGTGSEERESSHHGSVVMNLTSIHEDTGSIPGLAQWVMDTGIAMSCDVGHSHVLDLALL